MKFVEASPKGHQLELRYQDDQTKWQQGKVAAADCSLQSGNLEKAAVDSGMWAATGGGEDTGAGFSGAGDVPFPPVTMGSPAQHQYISSVKCSILYFTPIIGQFDTGQFDTADNLTLDNLTSGQFNTTCKNGNLTPRII